MSQSERRYEADTGSTPPVPGLWTLFGDFAAIVEPMGRSATKTNLEMQCLAGRRMRAYLALPQTLRDCRTPQDLVQAHLSFWQEAAMQYSDVAQRLMTTWQTVAQTVVEREVAGAAMARDLMTMPGPSPEAAGDRRQGDGTRRAA